jgi:hypothetical protein
MLDPEQHYDAAEDMRGIIDGVQLLFLVPIAIATLSTRMWLRGMGL